MAQLDCRILSDDGFIAFQYVKNLVHGAGLVYNPGERVEGYNNFLWIILLAIASKLLPSVKLFQIASALRVLFGALSILLVCRFSRMVRKEVGIFSLLLTWIARRLGYFDIPGRKRADEVNQELFHWLDDAQGKPFFAFLNYFARNRN